MKLIENYTNQFHGYSGESFRVLILNERDMTKDALEKIALDLRGKAIDVVAFPNSVTNSIQQMDLLAEFTRSLEYFFIGDRQRGKIEEF